MALARAALFLVGAKEPKLSKAPVIAIVDDDQSVREALTSLVRSLGFGAIAFECAEDLLNSKRRRRVSCSDCRCANAGDGTGPELHHRLVSSGEPIPTILITTCPTKGRGSTLSKRAQFCYLAKPFSEADLLACVRSNSQATSSRWQGLSTSLAFA